MRVFRNGIDTQTAAGHCPSRGDLVGGGLAEVLIASHFPPLTAQ